MGDGEAEEGPDLVAKLQESFRAAEDGLRVQGKDYEAGVITVLMKAARCVRVKHSLPFRPTERRDFALPV